ncbi:MAG: hypothetical protein GF349_04845 [Candidatus Magasanikbacteria bacterium]|nr:hypothetical protein [Candidatus Magasanikbacteria bacterium]
MEKKTKKSWIKRFFASRLFLVLSVLLIIMVGGGYFRAYYQDYKIRQEIRNLEREVQALEAKKIESMEILQYVMSDQYVEEKARMELNLKKPGEKVVVLKDLESGDKPIEGESGEESTGRDVSNPVKWLYYFTHNST